MPRLNNVLVALAASSVAVSVSAHGLAGTATSKHASKVKRQDCYSGYAETPLFQKKYSYVRHNLGPFSASGSKLIVCS
jgi:hypothetical protein